MSEVGGKESPQEQCEHEKTLWNYAFKYSLFSLLFGFKCSICNMKSH